MSSCCTCPGPNQGIASAKLPLICMVPREGGGSKPRVAKTKPLLNSPGTSATNDVPILDDKYIQKHFKLPPRALYMDPYRRPLITFPMTQEDSNNFNMDRKNKINQQILDGFLDPSEGVVSAPSVFPYADKINKSKNDKNEAETDEEIIYILQLPDLEYTCPIHNQIVKTPRFIWHSCKKTASDSATREMKRGKGPLHKPKPWLLSRHTDFDLLSQW